MNLYIPKVIYQPPDSRPELKEPKTHPCRTLLGSVSALEGSNLATLGTGLYWTATYCSRSRLERQQTFRGTGVPGVFQRHGATAGSPRILKPEPTASDSASN